MKSLEVEFYEGPGCNNENVEVKITTMLTTRQFRIGKSRKLKECSLDLRLRPLQNKVKANPSIIKKICGRKMRLQFNNVDNIPFFLLHSKTDSEFCLKRISIITVENQQFDRNFTTPKTQMSMWMPMFHESNLNYIYDRLSQMQCPENLVGVESCPNNNVRYKQQIQETRYCDFNPMCNSVSSSNPEHENSGYICYKTQRGQYTNYQLCCSLGRRGDMPACNEENEDNEDAEGIASGDYENY
jgi:hypothetical protein